MSDLGTVGVTLSLALFLAILEGNDDGVAQPTSNSCLA